MTTLEDQLRRQLNAELGASVPPPLAAADLARRGRSVQRRRRALAGVALSAVAVGGVALAGRSGSDSVTVPAAGGSITDRAEAYVQQFAQGDFDTVRADMPSDTVTLTPRSAYPAARLQLMWHDAVGVYGSLRAEGTAVARPVEGGTEVRVPFTLGATQATLLVTAFPQGVVGVDVLVPFSTGPQEDHRPYRARAIVAELAAGHDRSVTETFADSEHADAAGAWRAEVARLGAFVGITGSQLQNGTAVETLQFARGTGQLRLECDPTTYEVTSFELT